MGSLCSYCCEPKVEETVLMPSADVRRQLQEEAAEKRRIESESRGIKDPAKVRRNQMKAEEMERREQQIAQMGGNETALRWQAN